ncbi:MAG: hypothetical protein IPJ00_09965 [Saprospirales bacterium]|nr:hypothetical protein [Saprospirales bacterium]
MSPIAKSYKPVVRAKTSDGKLTGAALVGVNSVLLGWSLDEKLDRKDMLGFGIRRTDYDLLSGKMIRSEWFYGNKRFSHQMDKDYGPSISTYNAPLQRFNWSDYSVSPNRSYLYEIMPYWGDPKNMRREEALQLHIRPSQPHVGDWGVYTNRGVTSTMAYQERFNSVNPQDDSEARTWLSRGLKESLLEIIKGAAKGDGLHICIYEFEDHDVAAALRSAVLRGVDVGIAFHAKKGSGSTGKAREENLHMIAEHELQNNTFAREKTLNISHNKFLIYLKAGKPHTVWTGTCNFTFAGFYLQTNMALQLSHGPTAEAYEAYYQLMKTDPDCGGEKQPQQGDNRKTHFGGGKEAEQKKLEDQFFARQHGSPAGLYCRIHLQSEERPVHERALRPGQRPAQSPGRQLPADHRIRALQYYRQEEDRRPQFPLHALLHAQPPGDLHGPGLGRQGLRQPQDTHQEPGDRPLGRKPRGHRRHRQFQRRGLHEKRREFLDHRGRPATGRYRHHRIRPDVGTL